MSTKIIFTDLRSDNIPLSTESIMGVDKLLTTDSIEQEKTTEKIITKFPSSGAYFSTESIAEIPPLSTDLKNLDTNITEDSNKLVMSTIKLLTDSYVDDASFSIEVISDADEVNIFPINMTQQTSYATTLPTLTTEKKTFDKNVTKKMPTITSKFTKLDERITEASGEEEISTAQLL